MARAKTGDDVASGPGPDAKVEASLGAMFKPEEVGPAPDQKFKSIDDLMAAAEETQPRGARGADGRGQQGAFGADDVSYDQAKEAVSSPGGCSAASRWSARC